MFLQPGVAESAFAARGRIEIFDDPERGPQHRHEYHLRNAVALPDQRGKIERLSHNRAAASHGWGICSDIEPQTDLEKALYAIDELTGLVVTTALIRPSKSVLDVQVKSVKNKWKDKRFAAGVNRAVIEKGAAMLGVSLDELIEDTIKGMQEVAEAIGLKGNPA